MPNWCSNTLHISGDDDKVKSFFNNGIQNGLWKMSLYFPMPKELEETTAPSKENNEDLIKRFGYDNWYDWRCANYGTKWDADSENYGDDHVYFETAWSPPLPWLEKVAKDYPELTFRLDYSEEGMQFGGTCVALHIDGEFASANQVCDLVMQDEYGVKMGDVGYAYNIKNPENITYSIIADRSPSRKYSQEKSVLANSELGLKNPSGNNGFNTAIINSHIFTGSVNFFLNPKSQFYTNGHLPTQSQITSLSKYLIELNKIKLPK